MWILIFVEAVIMKKIAHFFNTVKFLFVQNIFEIKNHM